jgi:hypothetical protein
MPQWHRGSTECPHRNRDEHRTNDCHATVDWPATFDPSIVADPWAVNSECIQSRFPDNPPCVPMEHCDVKNKDDTESPPEIIEDPWDPYYLQFVVTKVHFESSRTADSTVSIFTGDEDEKHPNRQSVLELFAPVAQITNGSLSCGGVGELPVPAAKVGVGELGKPYDDYKVYKAAEHGKTLDATVTAPPKRFTWAVSGGIYDLSIQPVCEATGTSTSTSSTMRPTLGRR